MAEIILLGLIVGIIFYEITDISPGGLIVPGMIAYYIFDPYRIIVTVVVSLISLLIVKLISNHTILYGKRRFVVHIVVAILLTFLINATGQRYGFAYLTIPAIGFIIPGIISNEMNKQGILKTLTGLFIVTGLISLLVLLIWNLK